MLYHFFSSPPQHIMFILGKCRRRTVQAYLGYKHYWLLIYSNIHSQFSLSAAVFQFIFLAFSIWISSNWILRFFISFYFFIFFSLSGVPWAWRGEWNRQTSAGLAQQVAAQAGIVSHTAGQHSRCGWAGLKTHGDPQSAISRYSGGLITMYCTCSLALLHTELNFKYFPFVLVNTGFYNHNMNWLMHIIGMFKSWQDKTNVLVKNETFLHVCICFWIFDCSVEKVILL